MKNLVLAVVSTFAFFSTQAQEVASDIEIVDEIKTVVMTIDADRPNDLRNFDWRGNLTEVFKDVPDNAVIGIRVNIRDKQLSSDSSTLPNVLSLYAQDYAKNKEELLTKAVKMVAGFLDDNQEGTTK